ncbi:hypothetical protein V1T75_02735 [Tenacibaculum sp. FZY0031]|uniref:hypothetical protein n=1 Tax=Tenacibaculum sp. FZY0031 TaxID=3116648 RepID=UPI002E9B37B8|nr:hypothetical protein [Tenacibaculum sp. FZY0031]
MNLIKVMLAALLIGYTVNSKAQTIVKTTSKRTIILNNEKNKTIEVTITKNGKKITEQFTSYKELKNTNKFDKYGIDISNYFDIRNNQIFLNTNDIKTTSKSKRKETPKKLTSIINIEDNRIKIDLEIKE